MVFAIGLREMIFLNLLRVVTSGCADGSDGVDGAGNPIDTQTGLVWGALGAPTARRGEGSPPRIPCPTNDADDLKDTKILNPTIKKFGEQIHMTATK